MVRRRGVRAILGTPHLRAPAYRRHIFFVQKHNVDYSVEECLDLRRSGFRILEDHDCYPDAANIVERRRQ